MRNKSTIPLNQSRLFKVTSPAKLGEILGIKPEDFDFLTQGENRYREFDIEKKGGGVRNVEDPIKPLKVTQSRIADMLSKIRPPDFLYCPVRSRCYVSNASAHRNNRVVHCLDIKKFYPNTPSRRVFWFFKNVMLCRKDVAAILTAISTYKGRLPTGSPLSPILAYFSYQDLWASIAVYCLERGYVLTIYVDDITISGTKVPEADIWQIQKMIHGYGLRYHKQKSFVDRPAEITGVIVDKGRVLIPNRQHLKRLNTQKELRRTIGDKSALQARLAGIEGQARQVAKHNLAH